MNTRVFVNGKLAAGEQYTPRGAKCAPPEDTPAKTLESTVKVEPPSLDALVASQRFLVLSLPDCPQCEELAAALASRGVPSSSVVVKWKKSDSEYPALKEALAVHAGDCFSFPQVFSDGVYQGGYVEVLSKMELGAFDILLEELFSTEPVTVQRWVERQPMVVFSLPSCPQCDELRAQLDDRGVPVDKVFIKWDKGMPQYRSLKTQLIQLTGRSEFSFPQTFVQSDYQGSFEEVSAKLAAGGFNDFFANAFGIEPPALTTVATPAAISFDDDF